MVNVGIYSTKVSCGSSSNHHLYPKIPPSYFRRNNPRPRVPRCSSRKVTLVRQVIDTGCELEPAELVTGRNVYNLAALLMPQCPFRGTHNSYRDHDSGLSGNVAVPFRGTHNSYLNYPDMKLSKVSQCPFAAHITPTYEL
jgi:hypothetical protein